MENEGRIQAALLDVKLNDEMVFPVADAFVVRSVLFVFTSGYDVFAGHYSLTPRCQQPADIASIITQLTMILPEMSDNGRADL